MLDDRSAAAANPESEKDMEEILSSIRQIISDDDDTPTEAAAPENKSAPAGEAEVLELTREVSDEADVATPQEAEAPETTAEAAPSTPSSQDDIDSLFDEAPATTEATETTPAEESQEADNATEEETEALEMADQVMAPSAPSGSSAAEEEDVAAIPVTPAHDFAQDVLSARALEESNAALSQLSALSEEMAQTAMRKGLGQAVGDCTIEQLMREMLQPMLKEWLDTHLPGLVKWVVTEEVAKMRKEAAKHK